MNDQKDRSFVQNAIDTGLASVQGNPFLAQRIMNQETNVKPVMKRRMTVAYALALLLVVMIATAAAGATDEMFNAWIYRQWPDLALTLMPVNLSCEDRGIRMEVITAGVEDSEMLISYSMQDLEENRIDEHTETDMDIFYAGCRSSAGTWGDPLYDAGEHKIIFSEYIKFDAVISPKDNQLTATVRSLWPQRKIKVDLLPLFREYGDQAKPAFLPEDTYIMAGYSPYIGSSVYSNPDIYASSQNSLRVLDQSSIPDIPLADHVFLSGIGMVDGLLHVQFHLVDCDLKEILQDGQYTGYYPVKLWSYLYDASETEGYDVQNKYKDQEKLPGGITCLAWGSQLTKAEYNSSRKQLLSTDSGSNGAQAWEAWVEYIYTVDSELTESQVFQAEITFTDPPLFGNWEVNIPLRLVKNAL